MQCKIKKIRVENKMSQEELSEKSGVSRAIISGLESGRIDVTTTDTLVKIATALNRKVSLNYSRELKNFYDRPRWSFKTVSHDNSERMCSKKGILSP